MDLKELGITAEDLQERVIERVTERVLSSPIFDEDGGESRTASHFARALDAKIKARVDSKIDELAQKHVLPNVSAYIENLTLTETNKWGEAQKKPVTFIEYLAARAERYMNEMVSFDGKGKDEDSYNWRGTQTRITYLIEKHLQYSINTALTSALKTVNESIAGGVAETVKAQLKQITATITAQVRS